jgi:hypothetical protein
MTEAEKVLAEVTKIKYQNLVQKWLKTISGLGAEVVENNLRTWCRSG